MKLLKHDLKQIKMLKSFDFSKNNECIIEKIKERTHQRHERDDIKGINNKIKHHVFYLKKAKLLNSRDDIEIGEIIRVPLLTSKWHQSFTLLLKMYFAIFSDPDSLALLRNDKCIERLLLYQNSKRSKEKFNR